MTHLVDIDPLDHFQDREEAIAAFDNLWETDRNWILAFDGSTGYGKSTLINWLMENRCKPDGIPYSRFDFVSWSDYKSILNGLILGLEPWLNDPKRYRKKLDAILFDRDKRINHFHMIMIQTMDHVSGGQQAIQANLTGAVRELDWQMRDRLTVAWQDCLSRINENYLVLFLDSYERFQRKASTTDITWLWETLGYLRVQIPNFRVIICSQDKVKGIEHGTIRRTLGAFDSQHSAALLKSIGVTDLEFQSKVFQNLSKGHPLVTMATAKAWLLARQKGNLWKADDLPSMSQLEEVVERVQSVIWDQLDATLREAVPWLAVLRTFNRETLNTLMKPEAALNFDQFRRLASYSFVEKTDSGLGWVCHPLVRQIQIGELKREKKEFAELHKHAAKCFTGIDTFEVLYHRFFFEADRAFEDWQKQTAEASNKYKHDDWRRLLDVIESPEIELSFEQKGEGLFMRATQFYFAREFFQARQYYQEAGDIFNAVEDRLHEADCIRMLGEIHVYLSEPDFARQRYEEALNIFQDIEDHSGQAACIRGIGTVHMRQLELLKAQQHYEHALPIFKSIGDRLGEATCIRDLGEVHMRQLELPKAQQHYEHALPIFKSVGDRLGEATCIRDLGEVYLRMRKLNKARQYYKEAQKKFDGILDRLGEANCIRGLGDVYRELDEFPKAKVQYTNSLELYKKLGTQQEYVNTLGILALLLAQMDIKDEAIKYVGNCIRQSLTLQDASRVAQAYFVAGNVYEEFKQYEKAVDTYNKAKEIRPDIIAPYLNTAACHLRLLQLNEAEASLSQARQLQPGHGVISLLYAELYALQGNGSASLAETDKAIAHSGIREALIWIIRSMALLLLKRQEEAIDSVKRAVELTKDPRYFDKYIEDIERFRSRQPNSEGIAEVIRVVKNKVQ